MAEDYQNTTSGSCSDQTTLNGIRFLCLLRFGKLSLGYAENVFVQGLCEYVALSIADRRSSLSRYQNKYRPLFVIIFLINKKPQKLKKQQQKKPNNNNNNQNQNKNKSKKFKKKVILFGALS